MVRNSRCWPIAVASTLSLIISACSGDDDDDGEAKRSPGASELITETAINWARLISASPQTCND